MAETLAGAAKFRAYIIEEIRRLTEANGGQVPGKQAFAEATGITEGQWSGTYWARWSDAISEAGFRPNVLNKRLHSDVLLSKILEACRRYGHLPTFAEFKLLKRKDPTFPNSKTISAHFRNQAGVVEAIRARISHDKTYRDIAAMLPPAVEAPASTDADDGASVDAGHVYLLKSGQHYKIGRSSNLERRVREVSIALPESLTLVHAISTDDEAGIEHYWHRRFAHLRVRLGAEWFRLGPAEIRAFKKRKFQ